MTLLIEIVGDKGADDDATDEGHRHIKEIKRLN